jgi:hypothetical protein
MRRDHLFDCERHSVSLSQKGFASLIDLFFGDYSSPTVGSLFPTRRLQRLAALAIRYASFMPLLLPFSRGFTTCIAPYKEWSVMTPRAVVDWTFWRLVLRHAIYNPAWFEVDYSTPLLFYSIRVKSQEDLAQRQARAANTCLFVDACTGDKWIGIYAPGEFSAYLLLSFWCYYLSYLRLFVPVNINVLEFVAARLGALFTST